MYRVLKPTYERTGESILTPDGPMHWHRVVFVDLGVAKNMEEALEKFQRCITNGYSPVLEWIGRPH